MKRPVADNEEDNHHYAQENEGESQEGDKEESDQEIVEQIVPEGPHVRLPYSISFPWIFFFDEMLQMKSRNRAFLKANAAVY